MDPLGPWPLLHRLHRLRGDDTCRWTERVAAIDGRIDEPRSEVGERIAELQARGGEDPVYWLRKLVFRSAWLDHRIKHGQVDVAFDDNVFATGSGASLSASARALRSLVLTPFSLPVTTAPNS
mgnify:CR=1 FL=1